MSERVRAAEDRREVFIQVGMESLEPLAPKYEASGHVYLNLDERYGDKKLRLICDYRERSSKMSQRELAKLIRAGRQSLKEK